jgi:hypothetical protein
VGGHAHAVALKGHEFTRAEHCQIKDDCHPERVIKRLYRIVFIAYNTPIFCCV